MGNKNSRKEEILENNYHLALQLVLCLKIIATQHESNEKWRAMTFDVLNFFLCVLFLWNTKSTRQQN